MPTAYTAMLALDSKAGQVVDLKTPILTYIHNMYSEREARDASDEVSTIQRLRTEAVGTQETALPPRMKETLARYYRSLIAVELRFPIGKELGQVQVSFTWSDAFKTKTKASQSNIHHEMASVLFNLAALMSQQGVSCDRDSADGLKQACVHFQEAAGVLAFMRENHSSKIETPRPPDTSPEVVKLLEKLMMAQAQECIYNKAVIDHKSPSTIARLAKQTYIMYSDVERGLSTPILVHYFETPASWRGRSKSDPFEYRVWVQLKKSLYDVETLFQCAKGYRLNKQIPEEIAVLTEAFKRIQSTKKLAKAGPPEFPPTVARLQDAIQLAFAKAEDDNAHIFLERVPLFLNLPSVEAALLAKVIHPASTRLLDASQENLLSTMVPDSCAKAISKYTDMVDNLTRDALDMLEKSTDEARLYLREWELPELVDALDNRTSIALPDSLRLELEKIESVSGVLHLKGVLAELGEMQKSVDADLFHCQDVLGEDAHKDAECRNKYAGKWLPPPAATVAKGYWDKLGMYKSSLLSAAGSDASVMQRLSDMEESFSALRIDSAMLLMPRLVAPMVHAGPDDPSTVAASLRRSLESMRVMAEERGELEEELKAIKRRDHVLPKMMAISSQGYNALFAEEMKKYQPIVERVKRNSKAQKELLVVLRIECKTYKAVFDVEGWKDSCNLAAAGIRETARIFRELLDHLSEGLRFYVGTADVVQRYRQECQDYCYTRAVQREEVEQEIDRRGGIGEADRLAQRIQAVGLLPPGASAALPGAYPVPPPPDGGPSSPHGPPPQMQYRPNPGGPPSSHGPPPEIQYRSNPEGPPPLHGPPPQMQYRSNPRGPPSLHAPPPQMQYRSNPEGPPPLHGPPPQMLYGSNPGGPPSPNGPPPQMQYGSNPRGPPSPHGPPPQMQYGSNPGGPPSPHGPPPQMQYGSNPVGPPLPHEAPPQMQYGSNSAQQAHYSQPPPPHYQSQLGQPSSPHYGGLQYASSQAGQLQYNRQQHYNGHQQYAPPPPPPPPSALSTTPPMQHQQQYTAGSQASSAPPPPPQPPPPQPPPYGDYL